MSFEVDRFDQIIIISLMDDDSSNLSDKNLDEFIEQVYWTTSFELLKNYRNTQNKCNYGRSNRTETNRDKTIAKILFKT